MMASHRHRPFRCTSGGEALVAAGLSQGCAAPRQVRGRQRGGGSNVWGLVCTAWLLLCCSVGVCQATPTTGDGKSLIQSPLQATGSSLLCEILGDVIPEYQSRSGVAVNYTCSGSGVGKDAILSQPEKWSFVVTDSVFSEAEFAANPGLQLIPVAAAPVAVVYNLPGTTKLLLDRTAVAGIFKGTITRWSDPLLRELNPQVALPDVGIGVVVRSDSSGSTEILTRALESFNESVLGVGEDACVWPHHTPVGQFRAAGTSGVLSAVNAAPYSISYAGIASAMAAQVSFAVIQNRVGEHTFPGLRHADTAMQQLRIDPHRLTGSLVDGLGYPLSGLSYFALDLKSAGVCSALDFLYWVLTDTSANGVIAANALIPLSDEIKNLVLHRLTTGLCADRLLLPLGVSVGSTPSIVPYVNTISYAFHRAVSGNRFVYTSTSEMQAGAAGASSSGLSSFYPAALSGPNLETRTDAMVGKAPSSGVVFPLWVELLAVVVNIGVPASVIEVPAEDLRKVIQGEVLTWEVFWKHNKYIQSPGSQIKLVAQGNFELYETVLRRLANSSKAAFGFAHLPHIEVVDSLQSAAQKVSMSPGTLSVVPESIASSYGLTVIKPVFTDSVGRKITPEMDAFGSMLSSLSYDEETNEVFSNSHSVYPFYRVIFLVLPENARRQFLHYPPTPEGAAARAVDSVALTDVNWTMSSPLVLNPLFANQAVFSENTNGSSSGDVCDIHHALFAEWLFYNSTSHAAMRALGVHHLNSMVDYATKLRQLQCDGVYVFPVRTVTEEEKSYLYIYLLVGVCCTSLVLILLSYLAYSWHQERERYQSVYGVTVLAAELAEAVCVLDFTELEKLHDIPHPNRIQLAMRTIFLMMREFVKYIPRQVIKAVQQKTSHSGGSRSGGHSGSHHRPRHPNLPSVSDNRSGAYLKEGSVGGFGQELDSPSTSRLSFRDPDDPLSAYRTVSDRRESGGDVSLHFSGTKDIDALSSLRSAPGSSASLGRDPRVTVTFPRERSSGSGLGSMGGSANGPFPGSSSSTNTFMTETPVTVLPMHHLSTVSSVSGSTHSLHALNTSPNASDEVKPGLTDSEDRSSGVGKDDADRETSKGSPREVQSTHVPSSSRESTASSIIHSTHTRDDGSPGTLAIDLSDDRHDELDRRARSPGSALATFPHLNIHLLDTATQKVGVLAVRVNVPSHLSDVPLDKLHTAFLENVLWCVESCNGVVHKISEDSVLATWGCMGSRIHRSHQIYCAMSIVENAPLHGPRPHIGIHYGKASCGAIGTSDIKTFHVLGGVVEEADHLSRISQLSHSPCLLWKEFLSDSIKSRYTLADFFQVTSATNKPPADCMVLLCRKKKGTTLRRCDDLALALEALVHDRNTVRVKEYIDKTKGQTADYLASFVTWMSGVVQSELLVGMGGVPLILEPGNAGTLFTLQGHVVSRLNEPHYRTTEKVASGPGLLPSVSSLTDMLSIASSGRPVVIRRMGGSDAGHPLAPENSAEKRSTALQDARQHKHKRMKSNVTVKFSRASEVKRSRSAEVPRPH